MKKDRKKSVKHAAREKHPWNVAGCMSTVLPQDLRRHRDQQLGKMGAASEVRKIDPASYKP